MDTRTFAVRSRSAPPPSVPHHTSAAGRSGSGAPWVLGIAFAAAVVAVALVARRRRQRLVAHSPIADPR